MTVLDSGTRQPPLLEITGLEVEFLSPRGPVRAVRGVDLRIDFGESVALVGESGSGKTVTAEAIMGLTQLPGRIKAGEIVWKGESLISPRGRGAAGQRVWGKEISMVFQDPMTSLNPLLTVGTQITEVLERHAGMRRRAALGRAAELLEMVGMSSPVDRLKQYPHELSGGMRQRAMIAAALACGPELLIADEPTTALDVTIQAQILDLLDRLRRELHLAILLITHDLGVVAELSDRVVVMYAGRVVEEAYADDLFEQPGHPYTLGLLQSLPRVNEVRERLLSIPGSLPDAREEVPGCVFRPRCSFATDDCGKRPALHQYENARSVACWHAFGGQEHRVSIDAV